MDTYDDMTKDQIISLMYCRDKEINDLVRTIKNRSGDLREVSAELDDAQKRIKELYEALYMAQAKANGSRVIMYGMILIVSLSVLGGIFGAYLQGVM